MRQLPGLIDVTSDLLIENPQVTVDIDREPAGQLGVSASEIENTLYDAFGQRQVSTIYTSTNEYWVVMELLPRVPAGRRRARQALGAVDARTARAAQHRREVQLLGRAGDGESLGPAAVGDGVVQPRAGRVARHRASRRSSRTAKEVLPTTVAASFSGIAEAFVTTQQGLLAADAARGVRDLRDPRRAVRELHPPDHDSHRAAVRGVRRARHADSCRARPRHLRVRRASSC